MRTLITALAIVGLIGTPSAHAFEQSTKNPKAGQFCATKEAGLKVAGLVCKKSGSRYRWTY